MISLDGVSVVFAAVTECDDGDAPSDEGQEQFKRFVDIVPRKPIEGFNEQKGVILDETQFERTQEHAELSLGGILALKCRDTEVSI